MINLEDFYTHWESLDLEVSSKASGVTPEVVGSILTSYVVKKYTDVRNVGHRLAYQVLCTQRIIVPNKPGYVPGGEPPDEFHNYPAILMNKLTPVLPTSVLQPPPSPRSLDLVSYEPKTLNSSVTSTHSSNEGEGGIVTRQNSSGSSMSQTNSYSVGLSLGATGGAPTGSLSLGHDQGSSAERSWSNSTGEQVSRDRQRSQSDTMSTKDWACYSYVPTRGSLTWVWGQEYPWNVLDYRPGKLSVLPKFVEALLVDGDYLLPPSPLAQFGVDFTMQSLWTIYNDEASFTHEVDYYQASHGLPATGKAMAKVGGKREPKSAAEGSTLVTAKISEPRSFKKTIGSLDLCRYGLDPISSDRAMAIVGFVRYLVRPVPADGKGKDPVKFKILSTANNLLIKDSTVYPTGLTAPAGFTASENFLTADMTPACAKLEISVQFKIMDVDRLYALYIKHWKTKKAGIRLKIAFNGEPPLEKYCDAFPAEGGEGNLLAISLRDLDYGSVDYHDYLKLGINEVLITIEAIDPGAAECQYRIRAISVEPE